MLLASRLRSTEGSGRGGIRTHGSTTPLGVSEFTYENGRVKMSLNVRLPAEQRLETLSYHKAAGPHPSIGRVGSWHWNIWV